MSGRPTSKNRMHPTLNGLLWISPWLIGFVCFMAIPLGLSFYYSISDFPLLGSPVVVGLDNYERMIGDATFWTAVRNTLVFAAVVIPATTVVSIALAVVLNAKARGQTVHRAIIFLPTLVPIVATSIVWKWLYNGDHGLINRGLGLIGIRGPNWLDDPRYAMPALMLMAVWTIGQAVVIYLAALQDVPRSLYEAASLDGVGPAGRVRHVTIPMISPVIFFNVVIGMIGALQIFVQPYIMTGGGPGDATKFYAMYMFDQAFRFRDMGYANAMAWVQLVFILAVTGGLFAVSRRLVHYEGA